MRANDRLQRAMTIVIVGCVIAAAERPCTAVSYVTCYADILFVGDPDVRERCPEDEPELEAMGEEIEEIIDPEERAGPSGEGAGPPGECTGNELIDLRGDFNTDGVVNTCDRDEVLAYSGNLDLFPDVADLNNDGQVDIADLVTFFHTYSSGSLRVDWNLDGVLNIADIAGYFYAYYSPS